VAKSIAKLNGEPWADWPSESATDEICPSKIIVLEIIHSFESSLEGHRMRERNYLCV